MFTFTKEQLNGNLETYSAILAAIWQRKPIIFVSKLRENNDSIIENIFNFVPEYRQLIICGNISNKLFYGPKSAKKLEIDNLKSRLETLQSCYNEDGILSPPIQLIYSGAGEKDFLEVLSALKYGWIATTSMEKKHVIKLFNSDTLYQVELDGIIMVFPEGRPKDTALEERVLEKTKFKLPTVTRFILQRKMSEVSFVCKAFLDEIERGQTINQSEVEEQFGIDDLTFKKALNLLEVEYHIDPNPYFHFASGLVRKFLKRLLEMNGVVAAVAEKEEKIIALEKKETTMVITPDLFIPFVRLLKESGNQSFWGDDLSLVVMIKNDTKLYFCYRSFPPEGKYISFGFFLNSSIQLPLFISEMENLFEEYEKV